MLKTIIRLSLLLVFALVASTALFACSSRYSVMNIKSMRPAPAVSQNSQHVNQLVNRNIDKKVKE